MDLKYQFQWNSEFELPDGSYSISHIQDYFEHILKNHEEKAVNLSLGIYINKKDNRITLQLKQDSILSL